MSDQTAEPEPQAPDDETFSPEVQAILDQALKYHGEIPNAESKARALYDQRRAAVMKARTMGVSGYRLSKLMGVSQTTIANICAEK